MGGVRKKRRKAEGKVRRRKERKGACGISHKEEKELCVRTMRACASGMSVEVRALDEAALLEGGLGGVGRSMKNTRPWHDAVQQCRPPPLLLQHPRNNVPADVLLTRLWAFLL